MIKVPSIDLYSPSGASIYHGADSKKNAAFLRALPRNIPGLVPAKMSEIRPSLREAVDMFVQLRPHEARLLAGKSYVVFALTYPNEARCKAQNDAIQQLEARIGHMNIRVVEVRLVKPE